MIGINEDRESTSAIQRLKDLRREKVERECEIHNIRCRIVELDLKIADAKAIANCQHEWSVRHERVEHKVPTSFSSGMGWKLADVPDNYKIEHSDKWIRTCSVCGEAEETTEFAESVERVPRWKS
jgi:5-methylcytosine-specific restriction endonuclease McrA